MTPNERSQIEQIVYDILRKELGNYTTTDKTIILSKSIDIKTPNGFNGSLGSSGGKAGVYGQSTTRASAIAAPTAAGGAYSQSQVNSVVDAVNYIRTALTNFGITL